MATNPINILPATRRGYPPGPALLPRLLSGRAFGENGAEFMLSSARTYGDLVHYALAGRHIYQLNHPDLIADFFLKDASKHHRNLVMQRARDILGNGLLTSEEPVHMRQRRLAQPAFLRERIAAYAEVIGANALALSSRWQPGTVTDLHPAMLELALRIVGKCLFDLDTLDDVAQIASAVDSFMSFLPLAFLPFSRQLQRAPIPAMQRIERGKRTLDTLIYGMIAERRAHPSDRGDLLSMLLSAVDPEPDAGTHIAAGQEVAANRMSDQQLHDECLTIMLAGHETTANALSFALHLLAENPEAQTRLADEARSVLAPNQIPTASDYARLPFARAVFAETMRLYPPVWVTGRQCVEPYEIAGFRIRPGDAVLAPQFAVHRDPRFFPNPTVFDPERFLDGADKSRPRFSYFPFAAGSRQCIAEGLAWMEGSLILATICRSWTLSPPPNAPARLAIKPAISLRPRRGIPLRLDLRP